VTDVIKAVRTFAATAVAVFALSAAWVAPHADDRSARDVPASWAEARQGDVDASIRLGRFYESRYWLAEREPEVRGNPADLVLAHVFFSIAGRSSNRLDALYGRNATAYWLRRVLGIEGTAVALAALPEWMWPRGGSFLDDGAAARPEAGAAASAAEDR
jgi:hypothetical protein